MKCQEAIPISNNEMRKIHRGGEEQPARPVGRKVNVSQSRREARSAAENRTRAPKAPKSPKPPKEKSKHPILRFIGRTLATVLCLGIMLGSVVAVGMVFYVVQATANDGDLLDLDNAAGQGVTAVMQPFVRRRRELEQVRAALHARGLDRLTLFAKVEDRQGWQSLPQWMDACDVVTVARGDLGSNLGLLHLPAAQKDIAARCRRAGKPFLVVLNSAYPNSERAQAIRADLSSRYDVTCVVANCLELDEADLRIVAPPYKSIEADSLTFEQGDTVLLLTPDRQTYYIAGKVRDGHV